MKQASWRPCWQRAGVAAGVAGLGPAGAAGPVGAGVLADRAGVDRAEGRGGEGDEDGGVGGDGGGDAFAADEPGADEVVGVAAVGLGAAGAGGGAPVAAGLVDHPVRHADGGDGAQELAGGGVDVLDVAAQPDGAGAGGGVPDVIEPGVVPGGVQPAKTRSSANWKCSTQVGQCRTPVGCHPGGRGPVFAPVPGALAGSGRESQHGPVVRVTGGSRWCGVLPGSVTGGGGVAPALLGSLAGDAEPHGDVGPGVAEVAEAGDGLAGGVLEVVGEVRPWW